MIRQDYIIRMIRELVQVLARVVLLKEQSLFAEALQELEAVLIKLRGAPLTDPPDTEDWIRFCLAGEGEPDGRLESMANAWKERGELLAVEQRDVASHHSYTVALGLLLERVNNGLVTRELLDQVGECLAQTDQGPLPPAVLRRLAAYYEGRGWFGRAEDSYFEWLETKDPDAEDAGLAFYERLGRLNEAQLRDGKLSQAEVEQGRQDFRHRKSELLQQKEMN